MWMNPTRQVHLDFHTSEHIPEVAAAFDAAQFAQTVRRAHINSMTVFARCHHGWLYYDSKSFPERVHPALAVRNLLLEQVKALHGAGIRAPVYITVQWDYYTASRFPQYLIRKRGGAHEGDAFTKAGFYQSLCVNTPYADFVEAQTREVCEVLGEALDGVFFDIVGIRPCWCAVCREKMREENIDLEDEEAVRAFAASSLERFKARMSAVVRGYRADATVFFNAGHVGPCTYGSREAYSHFELESLPSGSWGYLHFPVTARYAHLLGKDCLGMTGKFHTEWGDFHSLKNEAALEFECFRMLSFGFACSVGDQLPPCGALSEATYRLIGRVYEQVEAREAWARPSRPLVEAAVITPENKRYEHAMPGSVMGACQMLEELAIQFDIIDPDMDFTRYPLLIVPDDCVADAALQQKIDAYAAQGGRVIACYHGALGADGQYPACFGAAYAGENESFPDFIVAGGDLCAGLEAEQEYVVYEQGARLCALGASAVMEARAPYFARTGAHFCSHRYTPSANGETYPAALRQGDVILFAHPLFTQYRKNAPLWCKRILSNAVDALLPHRLVRHDGPSTLRVTLLEQREKRRAVLHVLSYIPVRKSATIDIIEERTTVRDVSFTLHLPRRVARARLVPEGAALAFDGAALRIPVIDGYAIMELLYEA